MIGDESPLRVALRNGRETGVSLCRCGDCQNEWYVPNHNDFTPKFCPYCGLKFLTVTEKDLLHGVDDPEFQRMISNAKKLGPALSKLGPALLAETIISEHLKGWLSETSTDESRRAFAATLIEELMRSGFALTHER